MLAAQCRWPPCTFFLPLLELAAARALASFDFCSLGACSHYTGAVSSESTVIDCGQRRSSPANQTHHGCTRERDGSRQPGGPWCPCTRDKTQRHAVLDGRSRWPPPFRCLFSGATRCALHRQQHALVWRRMTAAWPPQSQQRRRMQICSDIQKTGLKRNLMQAEKENSPVIMVAAKKTKKAQESINSRLALVMKSGKYTLGYKTTLKTLRSGKVNQRILCCMAATQQAWPVAVPVASSLLNWVHVCGTSGSQHTRKLKMEGAACLHTQCQQASHPLLTSRCHRAMRLNTSQHQRVRALATALYALSSDASAVQLNAS